MMTKQRKTSDLNDDLAMVRVMRLNAVVQGIATGTVIGLVVLVATLWLVIKGQVEGDLDVGPHLSLLGQYFIGYRVSYGGSLIGLAYGFACGFALGYLVASMYNWLVSRKDRKTH